MSYCHSMHFLRERKKTLYTFLYVFPDIWSFCARCHQSDITLAVPTIVPLHWIQKCVTLLDSIFVRLVRPHPCSLCILISMALIRILVKKNIVDVKNYSVVAKNYILTPVSQYKRSKVLPSIQRIIFKCVVSQLLLLLPPNLDLDIPKKVNLTT
jgi:hypothetical protein